MDRLAHYVQAFVRKPLTGCLTRARHSSHLKLQLVIHTCFSIQEDPTLYNDLLNEVQQKLGPNGKYAVVLLMKTRACSHISIESHVCSVSSFRPALLMILSILEPTLSQQPFKIVFTESKWDLSDLPRIEAALNESMRFKPVGPVVIRQATADTKIPFRVKRGDTIILDLAAAGTLLCRSVIYFSVVVVRFNAE